MHSEALHSFFLINSISNSKLIKNYQMKKTTQSKWKEALDNILIYNLYILIIGAIFLGICYILSVNEIPYLYHLFQKLWYPVFIPSLSLFFTAILFEAIFNKLINRTNS